MSSAWTRALPAWVRSCSTVIAAGPAAWFPGVPPEAACFLRLPNSMSSFSLFFLRLYTVQAAAPPAAATAPPPSRSGSAEEPEPLEPSELPEPDEPDMFSGIAATAAS